MWNEENKIKATFKSIRKRTTPRPKQWLISSIEERWWHSCPAKYSGEVEAQLSSHVLRDGGKVVQPSIHDRGRHNCPAKYSGEMEAQLSSHMHDTTDGHTSYAIDVGLR